MNSTLQRTSRLMALVIHVLSNEAAEVEEGMSHSELEQRFDAHGGKYSRIRDIGTINCVAARCPNTPEVITSKETADSLRSLRPTRSLRAEGAHNGWKYIESEHAWVPPLPSCPYLVPFGYIEQRMSGVFDPIPKVGCAVATAADLPESLRSAPRYPALPRSQQSWLYLDEEESTSGASRAHGKRKQQALPAEAVPVGTGTSAGTGASMGMGHQGAGEEGQAQASKRLRLASMEDLLSNSAGRGIGLGITSPVPPVRPANPQHPPTPITLPPIRSLLSSSGESSQPSDRMIDTATQTEFPPVNPTIRVPDLGLNFVSQMGSATVYLSEGMKRTGPDEAIIFGLMTNSDPDECNFAVFPTVGPYDPTTGLGRVPPEYEEELLRVHSELPRGARIVPDVWIQTCVFRDTWIRPEPYLMDRAKLDAILARRAQE